MKDNIRYVVPYVPGEQPDEKNMIKLNTNENPYPPAPGVKSILDSYSAEELRLYPSPVSKDLVEEIAALHKVDCDRVFVGVGSDDVLALMFLTYFNSGKPILFPDITYSFYDVWADLYRIPYKRPKLDDNFRIVPEDYKQENGGIVIANPNAPTGVFESQETIESIIEANKDVVVIIDEAYVDFGPATMMSLADKYDNVVVVRTFSKSRSLAGMRIGYAIGSKALIKALNDVRYSFNSYPMTRLSIQVGAESIKDEKYFNECVEKIKKTREWTKAELKNLGFTFPDSQTNFIFAKHEKVSAVTIFEELRKKHIYVRHFNADRIDNYLRITIGTDEEMKTFINEVKEILERQ
ncbi:MAG: histidinol-phosphate transaminase [Lachnospiraceae bacterium]|nr:histidinol-phosphate transaminase [Lachnospiraceae bacterium]